MAAVLMKVLVAGQQEVVLVTELDSLVDLGFRVVGRDEDLANCVLVNDGDDIWCQMLDNTWIGCAVSTGRCEGATTQEKKYCRWISATVLTYPHEQLFRISCGLVE